MTDELSRLARLEQKVLDNTELTERRFDANDASHDQIGEKLTEMDNKQDRILLEIERAKIKQKLAGGLLFTVGAFIGWVIREWHTIKGWL